jgi:hypothetical protein
MAVVAVGGPVPNSNERFHPIGILSQKCGVWMENPARGAVAKSSVQETLQSVIEAFPNLLFGALDSYRAATSDVDTQISKPR